MGINILPGLPAGPIEVRQQLVLGDGLTLRLVTIVEQHQQAIRRHVGECLVHGATGEDQGIPGGKVAADGGQGGSLAGTWVSSDPRSGVP